MALETILTIFSNKMIKYLPRILLNKLYPINKCMNDIEIDIRSKGGLRISIDSVDIPRIDIYFRITNKSPYIDIRLNVLSLDIWMEQPLCSASILRKEEIKRGETKEDIYCRTYLNSIQVQKIRERKTSVTLYGYVYFNTKIGEIEKKLEIENIKPEIT